MKTRRDSLTNSAMALFASATAWPAIGSAFIDLTLSPYERALRSALCSAHSQFGAQFLGHCTFCWEGVAALALTGAFLLALRSRQPVGFGVRMRR